MRAWLISLSLLGLFACSASDSGTNSSGSGDPSGTGASGPTGAGGGTTLFGSGGAGVSLVDPPGSDLRGDECAKSTQTANNTLQPADIIMALENGASMQADIEWVRDSLNGFSNQIVNSGVDARIILITDALDPDVVSTATPLGGPSGDWRAICVGPPLGSGNCPDDSNPARGFYHLDVEVGDGAGFVPTPERHALNMFTAVHPGYVGFLRPQAAKTFVVMTDRNATAPPNNSALAFTNAITALDPLNFPAFKLSAVVPFAECGLGTVPGTTYLDLVLQTGGIAGDFCLRDFAPVFNDIATGVAQFSQIDCEWTIPPPPPGESLQTDAVNVILTSDAGEVSIGNVPSSAECPRFAGGWHYDDRDAPTKVVACKESCDAIRAAPNPRIDVLYGCATVPAEIR